MNTYSLNDEGLIQSFYNKLQQFDTAISDSNLFYVSYSIPNALSDSVYSNIGETGNDGAIGISKTKDTFDRATIKALTVGVDIPDDKLDMEVLSHQSSANGYLPITVNKGRSIETTGLKTNFYDTNLSLNDFVFKPWIRLIARNGCFDKDLFTDVKVIFLGKYFQPTDGPTGLALKNKSVVRKQYTFRDCVPVDTENKDSYKYSVDPILLEQRVQWKFNRYDVKLTTLDGADNMPSNLAPGFGGASIFDNNLLA
jgi:hypothetical protein